MQFVYPRSTRSSQEVVWNARAFLDRIGIWKCWFLRGENRSTRRKTSQSREPTTNSTHIWRRVRESNPGHSGGRRVLSPCSPYLPSGAPVYFLFTFGGACLLLIYLRGRLSTSYLPSGVPVYFLFTFGGACLLLFSWTVLGRLALW